MNIASWQRLLRIWLWIAIACCILSALAAILYAQCPGGCANAIYFALYAGILTVLAFARGNTEWGIAQLEDALNSGLPHFWLLHVPFGMSCALTVAAPMLAFACVWRRSCGM